MATAKIILGKVSGFITDHLHHVIALLLVTLWCTPYITTGSRIELGDYSYFLQAYEAIRYSIAEYHQFPWFNPWVSGGVPMYANPQMGVFSIQTILVLIFGTPIGIKLAYATYTFAGYASMSLLLRKYFKIDKAPSALLSLVWIFCSFFVAHTLHFTFLWYMLTPLYVFLALTVKGWRGGLLLGFAFAVMALAQVHYPFIHLAAIAGLIIAARLLFEKENRRYLWQAAGSAAGLFLVLAGHRVLLTFQNAHDFPRLLVDTAPVIQGVIMGLALPFSLTNFFYFIQYPQAPILPHGFWEATATPGVFVLMLFGLTTLFVAYSIAVKKQSWKKYILPLGLLALIVLFFATALGSFASWSPYSLLKHLPVFSGMRVATRYLLGVVFAMLVFIGIMLKRSEKGSFFRFAAYTLLFLGASEMFLMNVGYQSILFIHEPFKPAKAIREYPFAQTAQLGQYMTVLPDGSPAPSTKVAGSNFREFDAMSYNLGTLYANDALVALVPWGGSPRCTWENGCGLVLSGNATIAEWSPNKIVFTRTAPGPIKLNMNNSNYFVVNGKRNADIRVAEPYQEFIINESDDVQTITVEAKPSLGTIVHKLNKKLTN